MCVYIHKYIVVGGKCRKSCLFVITVLRDYNNVSLSQLCSSVCPLFLVYVYFQSKVSQVKIWDRVKSR